MNKKVTSSMFLIFIFLSQQSYSQSMFQGFDLVASNPAGVVAAMDKLQATSVGEASSANVFLYRFLANGESQATHRVLVVHSSPGEMTANLALNATSPEWATFGREVSSVIGQFLGVGGDPNSVTSPNRIGMIYDMSVTNPAAYASAWTDFVEANSDQGVSYLIGAIADGSNPTTHTAANWANSLSELLMNQPQNLAGWESFSQRVSGIRTIEATSLIQLVASWSAE
jgi:hypothetical protein